jgi:hypothetical protein
MNKKSLIKNLLKDEILNKESYVFSLEYHKLTDKIGFFKLEAFDASAEKIIFKFKIQVDPSSPENAKSFASLKDGEENIQVGLVQLESKSLFSKFKEGITGSLGEGRIPFISGLFK